MAKKSWSAANIPDQSGRVAIVTGANSGIGYYTALELGRKGAEVVLACRSVPKAEAALADLLAECPEAKASVMPLDLSSFRSIREFVDAFRAGHDKLDLLINNAGVMVPPYDITKNGFELQFGTNHLGHFALTGRLFDLVIATEGARIVTVSSVAHRFGQIHFDDLNFKRKYNATKAYGQSKLANLLFTLELDRRLATSQHDTLSLGAHPGWTATNLQAHSGIAMAFNPYFGQTAPMGALPTLFAATSPNAKGGEYYGPAGMFELRGPPAPAKISARAQDAKLAGNLWHLSQELTGVSYPV